MVMKNVKTHSKKKKAKQYFDSKHYKESLELYLKVAALDPIDADAFYMSGTIYGLTRQHQPITQSDQVKA